MLLTSFSVPPDAGENLSFFGKLGGAAGGILYHWLSEEPSAQVTGTTTTGKGTYFTKRLSIIAHPRVEALLAGPVGFGSRVVGAPILFALNDLVGSACLTKNVSLAMVRASGGASPR
jgi:hypothetical protein